MRNPGVSFTLMMNQALKSWLGNPQITLNAADSVGEKEVQDFMDQNADLMDDLGR